MSLGNDENGYSTTREDCSINCISPVNNCDQAESNNEDAEMVFDSPIRNEETPSKMCYSRICVDLFSSRVDCNEVNKNV